MSAVGLLHLHVEGDLDMHGPPAPGEHGVEGAVHQERRLDRPDHLEVTLGDRRGDGGEVRRVKAIQLLHDPVIAHVCGDRAREQQQRRGVGVGGRQADDRVGRAGADRRGRSDRLSCDAVVRVGHVHGGLLVEHLDEGKFAVVVQEGVQQAPVAVARQSGHVGHAVGLEGLGDELSGREKHVQTPFVGNALVKWVAVGVGEPSRSRRTVAVRAWPSIPSAVLIAAVARATPAAAAGESTTW